MIGYYVTIWTGAKYRIARGPFDTYPLALAAVDATQRLASDLDPWSDFYGWGTTKITAPKLPIGPMNKLFGQEPLFTKS